MLIAADPLACPLRSHLRIMLCLLDVEINTQRYKDADL